MRIRIPAHVVREGFQAGVCADIEYRIDACTDVVIAFTFQVRSVTIAHFRRDHLVIDDEGVNITFMRRKGKSLLRPFMSCHHHTRGLLHGVI